MSDDNSKGKSAMNRIITSINPVNTKYGNTYVYVNFSDRTYGTRSWFADKKAWITAGMTDEELKNAKELSVRNGKWQPYKRSYVKQNTEDVRDDIAESNTYTSNHRDIECLEG